MPEIKAFWGPMEGVYGLDIDDVSVALCVTPVGDIQTIWPYRGVLFCKEMDRFSLDESQNLIMEWKRKFVSKFALGHVADVEAATKWIKEVNDVHYQKRVLS